MSAIVQGLFSEKWTLDDFGRRKGIQRQYRVLVSGSSTLSDAVAAVAALAAPTGLTASSISGALNGTSLVNYNVTADYEVPTPGANADPNPLARPAEITYSGIERREAYFFDQSETPQPVVNSAGELFDKQPERDASDAVITIVKNYALASLDPGDLISKRNTVNQDTLSIDDYMFDPETLLLSPPQIAKVTETVNGSPLTYYRVSVQLKFNSDTWTDQVPDYGYNEVIEGYLFPILDKSNQPVKKQWPMDGAGGAMTNPDDEATKLEFKPYKKATWYLATT